MTRDQLAHILRAACRIVEDPDPVVIGSQAILGTYSEEQLPDSAIASIEVDVAYRGDDDERKANQLDGAIGELSAFHNMFGYYGQGVSVTTAVLPAGWQDRLVKFETSQTSPGRGWCLESYDLVVSKLVAGREKDFEFAAALLEAGLVDANILTERADTLEAVQATRARVRHWVVAARKKLESES